VKGWGDTASCEGEGPDPKLQPFSGWRAVSYVNTENEEGTENIILLFFKLHLFTSHKRSCSSNSTFMNSYQKPVLKSYKPVFAGNEL